jgi:hypothetical protein
MVCSGDDVVVVSADSRGHSLKGEVEDYDKIQLVDRVVVAEAGLLLIRDKTQVVFDVHEWVARTTKKLQHPSASTVAKALAENARRLKALSDHPSVTRAERPQIIFLVAGFGEKVERVIVDLRPFAVHHDAQEDPIVAVGLGAHHLDDDGPLFSLAKKRRPDFQPTKLLERADWCGLLLTVESELNPLVAPPIRQALVGASGPPERRTFPSSEGPPRR